MHPEIHRKRVEQQPEWKALGKIQQGHPQQFRSGCDGFQIHPCLPTPLDSDFFAKPFNRTDTALG